MKALFLIPAIFCILSTASAQEYNQFDKWYTEAINRCLGPQEQKESITMELGLYGSTYETLQRKAVLSYNLSKRLPDFAYYDNEQGSFITMAPSGDEIRLTPYFIYGVRAQIEDALKRKLADFISITDMGIARFYVPKDKWKALGYRYGKLKKNNWKTIIERVAADRDTLVFYPSAMNFELQNRDVSNHVRFRQVNRNLVAKNFGDSVEVLYNLEDKFNTLWDIPGYKMLSAAFTISAHKDGCFGYDHNGKKRYFDITFRAIGHSAEDIEASKKW